MYNNIYHPSLSLENITLLSWNAWEKPNYIEISFTRNRGWKTPRNLQWTQQLCL